MSDHHPNDNNNNNNICFTNENYLNFIIVYLTVNEIVQLSLCNKQINKLLDPDNNKYINLLFLINLITKYFELDPSNNYIIKNKNNLSKVKFGMNFKSFLKQIKDDLDIYKDNKIGKRIADFFKIHIFLPDLRKECFTLEYENSSIHMLYSYDINLRLLNTYNFYSKYITVEDIILHKNEKHKPIRILRERLLFEENLINFYQMYSDYINNKGFCDYVNDYIFKYKYKEMDDIYKKCIHNFNFYCDNSSLQQIFNFIFWIIHMFIMYVNLNYEIVKGLFDEIDNNEELISEFLSKKSDLYNCGLLINSTFENVNIIINYLKMFKDFDDKIRSKNDSGNNNKYQSISNCSSADSESNLIEKEEEINTKEFTNKIISPEGKFTLYNFFLKIIDDLFIKKLKNIKNKFKSLATKVITEFFTTNSEALIEKGKKEEEKMNQMDICNEESDNEIIDEDVDDDISSFDSKPSKKEICENLMISVLDCSINGNNANAIMHSNIKVDAEYINDYEEPLCNILVQEIKECLKDKKEKMSLQQCFDIVETLTRCEGNSKNLFLSKNSFALVRRTKIRLMKKGFKAIFVILLVKLKEDFQDRIKKNNVTVFLTVVESLRSANYKCNLDALSEEGEKNVENNVKNDINEAQNYLIRECNLNEDQSKLAEKYLKSEQIEYVYLFNKFLWNYHKQIEIYKERDSRVEYYFTNKKGKDDNIYASANSTFEKVENNDINKKPSELFDNNNFNDKIKVPPINS